MEKKYYNEVKSLMKTKLCLALSEAFGIGLKEQMDLLKKVGFYAYFFGADDGVGVKGSQVIKEIKDYGDSIGLVCQSLHAPFLKAADMWEKSEKAELAVKELLDCLEACAACDIPILTCHCYIGFGPQNPNQIGIDNYGIVVARAKELGVKIAFENTEGEDYLKALMDAFKDEEHVGFCWDTGHEMCYNRSKNMMDLYGDRIIATHLNDNLGVRSYEEKITWLDDLHLLPFDGIADWNHIVNELNKYGFDDILSFELNIGSKPDRHENDLYGKMGIELYITEVYKRACKVAAMKEKAC